MKRADWNWTEHIPDWIDGQGVPARIGDTPAGSGLPYLVHEIRRLCLGRSPQTANTPELLVKNGFSYQCDWVNDELPYTFKTAEGDMTCLPSCLELDDVFVLTQNLHSEDSFTQQVIDAADLLIKEGGEQGGRLLALNLHPWLVGQPHRIVGGHPGQGVVDRNALDGILRDAVPFVLVPATTGDPLTRFRAVRGNRDHADHLVPAADVLQVENP